jgi:transcriptional antiterminator NusG
MEEQERLGEEQNPVGDGVEPARPTGEEASAEAHESPVLTPIQDDVDAGEPEAELSDLELPTGEFELDDSDDEFAEEPPVDIRAILRQAREEAKTASDEAEQAEPQTAGPDESPEERAWYVIHCYSGYEKKVKHNLEQRIETMGMADQIFQVIVPTEDEIEVKEGKRRTVERRVFPGYILVQMAMNDDSWYVVRNTPGVTGFVGMGNKPTPLRAEEVAGILKRMESEAPKVKVTFKPGQKVRIIDGPFNDFLGVVDDIDMDKAKARVLVSFFGRDTPVELDFLQVEKM